MTPMVSLTADRETLEAVLALAKRSDSVLETSEPAALDAAGALNAGLSANDIRSALEIAQLVFETAGVALVFLRQLRDFLRSSGGSVTVGDAESGKPLGRVRGDTTDEELARLAPR